MQNSRIGWFFTLALILMATGSQSAALEGHVFDIVLHSPALEGNPLGDPADRNVTIYLPSGYYASAKRYPVVYLLHAWGSQNNYYRNFVPRFDALVREGMLPPAILVMPDADNSYSGSWYTNSPATGNWENFIALDLVGYVDRTYRSIPWAAARGLAGQSMGGFGAMRLAMRHPEIFSVAYSTNGPMSFEGASNLLDSSRGLGRSVAAALTTMRGQTPTIAEKLAAAPLGMVGELTDNLAQLRGIGFLAGEQDGETLQNARAFSTALDAAGIPHSFTEHDGGHTDYFEEHIESIVLPFLAKKLDFEGIPAHLPRLHSFTPASVTTAVGLPAPLDIVVDLDPAQVAATDRLTLDLATLAMDAVPLEAIGDGRYTASLILTPSSSGHYDLPVHWKTDAGQSHVLLNISLKVQPGTDLTVLDDDLAPDWQVAPYRVEEIDFTQTAVTHSGTAAGTFQTQGGFAGWMLTFTPENPVRTLGYSTLRFAIHPEAAVPGSKPLFVLFVEPGNRVDLLDRAQLDLTREEWQLVELPLEEFELNGPITAMHLEGNFAATLYLDDLQLVAAAALDVPTAITETQTIGTPRDFILTQNYPNPFNSSTVIQFALPSTGPVELAIFNTTGQQIATLIDATWNAGAYAVHWDGRDDSGRELASGLYLYRLRTSSHMEARKLLLLR